MRSRLVVHRRLATSDSFDCSDNKIRLKYYGGTALRDDVLSMNNTRS